MTTSVAPAVVLGTTSTCWPAALSTWTTASTTAQDRTGAHAARRPRDVSVPADDQGRCAVAHVRGWPLPVTGSFTVVAAMVVVGLPRGSATWLKRIVRCSDMRLFTDSRRRLYTESHR